MSDRNIFDRVFNRAWGPALWVLMAAYVTPMAVGYLIGRFKRKTYRAAAAGLYLLVTLTFLLVMYDRVMPSFYELWPDVAPSEGAFQVALMAEIVLVIMGVLTASLRDLMTREYDLKLIHVPARALATAAIVAVTCFAVVSTGVRDGDPVEIARSLETRILDASPGEVDHINRAFGL